MYPVFISANYLPSLQLIKKFFTTNYRDLVTSFSTCSLPSFLPNFYVILFYWPLINKHQIYRLNRVPISEKLVIPLNSRKHGCHLTSFRANSQWRLHSGDSSGSTTESFVLFRHEALEEGARDERAKVPARAATLRYFCVLLKIIRTFYNTTGEDWPSLADRRSFSLRVLCTFREFRESSKAERYLANNVLRDRLSLNFPI